MWSFLKFDFNGLDLLILLMHIPMYIISSTTLTFLTASYFKSVIYA